MTVVVGRDAAGVAANARKWGWAESATDWREVIARDDIDVVDIVTPGDTHAEIAIAALEAGKHVLCEKPLANTVAEAEAMTAAAERAAERGIRSMVGFTYRRVPATTFARDLVAAGRIGEIRQVRAEYLQDWLMDAEAPLTWRMQKERAGSGALGDIGAHAVDLTEYITGQKVATVSGIIETLVTERPLLGEGVGLSGTASTERGAVTVDDIALFTGRLDSGALASFEATRFRTGRKNALRIEIVGLEGRDRVRPRAPERARVLRRDAARDRARLPPDPRHRARPPLPRAVVADRSYARLRAWLLTPGLRLRHGDRRRHPAAAVVRGRAARAARARRRRAQLGRRQRLDADRRLTRAALAPAQTPEGHPQ